MLEENLSRLIMGTHLDHPLFYDRSGDTTVLEILLSMGLRPKLDSSALYLAARDGLPDALQLLLNEGSIDPMMLVHKSSPLSAAAKYGQLSCVRILLADKRVHPESGLEEISPLNEACCPISRDRYQDYLEIIRLLLQDKRVTLSMDRDRDGIFYMPCYFGHLEIVDLLLLDGRADPNARDSDALRTAMMREHTSVVKRLLQDKRVRPIG